MVYFKENEKQIAMRNLDIQRILGPSLTYSIKKIVFPYKSHGCKELLNKNARFKGMHMGKRCFIIGNGPSISNIDFSLLKDEVTFSVNQLPRDSQFDKLYTTYHMWMDERFFNISENRPEDMELLDVMRKVNTSDNKPIVFYNIAAYNMIKKYKLDEELNIHYIAHTNIRDLGGLTNKIFDATTVFPIFPTVVHYLICLAVFMGIKEIILLGCDCTGIISIAESRLGNAENALYGYKITENEKKRLETFQTVTSFRDEMKWQVDLFDSYDFLNQYCKRNGVKLKNATSPTLLENIDRVKLEELINNS